MLVASIFFIVAAPGADAETVPPSSAITVLDQDFTAQPGIPENIVLGNHWRTSTDATMFYNSQAGAIEYRTAQGWIGSMYVGIEPFVNGNISVRLKVVSNAWNSNVYVVGSTFKLQCYSLPDGSARVESYYQTSPTTEAYRSYVVPASALPNGVNTINLMISGTTKTVTVYFDGARSVTTPMYYWGVQNLPYDPITMPIMWLENEKGGSATYVSTLLYGIKETVNGGVVSAIPGNDFASFGIDAPNEASNSRGVQYMAGAGQKGVAWADVALLAMFPAEVDFIRSLLAAGWELGIHYSVSLNSLSLPAAQSLMQNEYNQITSIFGRSPTTWCSFQNGDSVTHAIYAYNQLGMLWRWGYSGGLYIPHVGNLDQTTWPEFWSKISNAQMVYPSFTHSTDGTTASYYDISYSSFTTWIDNYDGKRIVGFNEYYHRVLNQVDTKINYLEYVQGERLRFSVECNEFPSRLVISFPNAGSATVLKNGNLLVKGTDYSVVDNGRIILFGNSNDLFEVTATGVPGAPRNLAAIAGNAQVVLNWTAPSSDGGSTITGYRIYRGTTPGGETLLTTVGNVLAYTDSAVTNGVTYYYNVRAVNAVGAGPPSNEVLAAPSSPPTAPSAPRDLVATPGNAQVALTWNAPASDGGAAITNYSVYRGSSSGGETLLTTIGNVRTFTDAAVTNGVTYYYVVKARNSVGEGPSSNEVSAKPVATITVPSAPQNLVATSGNGQITLSWSAPASNGGNAITGYRIYRGTTPGGETLLTNLGNVLTYTDTSVTNGQVYYYKVSAVNAVGASPLSNEASAAPATPSADFNYQFINSGTEVQIIGYRGSGGHVEIPAVIEGRPVTSIGDYAFYDVVSVTSLTIPGSVTSIGAAAFYRCSALASLSILDGVENIGAAAFYECTSLTSLSLPNSVITIGNDAFFFCSALTSLSLPNSVTSIGSGAFAYCNALTSLTIPGSVTSIGEYTFYECTSLTSLNILDGVQTIGSYAFYRCLALTSLSLPNSITAIGPGAFAYCNALASLTIPNSVTSIGDYAFYEVVSVTSLTIPGSVTSIGAAAFYRCSALTTLTILDGVETIGNDAFFFCSALTTLSLPNSVTTIGSGAFAYCSALTSLTIPNSVTSIGEYAFYECSALTSMTFEGNAPTCGDYWINGHNAALVIYYYEGATGFTAPTWEGVPTVSLPAP